MFVIVDKCNKINPRGCGDRTSQKEGLLQTTPINLVYMITMIQYFLYEAVAVGINPQRIGAAYTLVPGYDIENETRRYLLS